jgi:hypothetical protein
MIFCPYEVFVGSDILDLSFELPNSLLSVFTEDDRVPTIPEEEQDDDHSPECRYEAPVKVIRDRLEIMGYTSAKWHEELEDAGYCLGPIDGFDPSCLWNLTRVSRVPRRVGCTCGRRRRDHGRNTRYVLGCIGHGGDRRRRGDVRNLRVSQPEVDEAMWLPSSSASEDWAELIIDWKWCFI